MTLPSAPGDMPYATDLKTRQLAAPVRRRNYTTPFGVREYGKADASAYEYSSRTKVTSASHPAYHQHKEQEV